MGKSSQRATGLTVSALAVAMLISGLTPGGGSLNDFSISSDDGTIQEDTTPRAYSELTATRGIGKPEGRSEDISSSGAKDAEIRTSGRSVVRDSDGSYYLADQLLLRVGDRAQPQSVLRELDPVGSLRLAAENPDRREYRVLLPETHSKPELGRIAQSWEAHSQVESASVIELSPLRDAELISA